MELSVGNLLDDLDEEREWVSVFVRHLDEWNLDSAVHGTINIRDYPEEYVRRFLARGVSDEFAAAVRFVRAPINALVFEIELKLKELNARPFAVTAAENDSLAQMMSLIPFHLEAARSTKDYSVMKHHLSRVESIVQLIDFVSLQRPALRRSEN
jgi:hypothetical protein